MPRIEFQGQIHEFPDSFTDEQIAEALRSESGVGKMLPAHKDKYKAKQERKAALRATLAAGKNLPIGMGPLNPGQIPSLSQANREMPAALGAVGGAFGGVPGAALGGMAGKALQYGTNPMLGEEQPQGQAPMNILGEGGLQGLLQGGGDLAAWALNNTGRAALPLMQHALKAGKNVFKEFPGINPAEVALEHGIRPQPGIEMRGSQAAEGVRINAANATDQAIDDAWRGGYSGATPNEIARGPGMRAIKRSLDRGPAPITDPAQLEDLIVNEFLAKHPNASFRGVNTPSVPNGRIVTQNVIVPPRMNELRQAAGAQAFAGPDKAQGVMARGATASNYKLYNEGLWKNLTREMEKNVPNFKELNLETQKAMALEKAMQAIENPGGSELPHGFWQAVVKAVRGTDVTGRAALAAQAIGKSPRTPVLAEGARQTPRGISEILRYLSSPQDSTSQY